MKKEEGFMTQLDPFQFGLGLKTSWTRVNLLYFVLFANIWRLSTAATMTFKTSSYH